MILRKIVWYSKRVRKGHTRIFYIHRARLLCSRKNKKKKTMTFVFTPVFLTNLKNDFFFSNKKNAYTFRTAYSLLRNRALKSTRLCCFFFIVLPQYFFTQIYPFF